MLMHVRYLFLFRVLREHCVVHYPLLNNERCELVHPLLVQLLVRAGALYQHRHLPQHTLLALTLLALLAPR